MPKISSRYLEELSELLEPAMRKSFLAAVSKITDRASITALERQIANGDIDGALRALDIDPSDFSRVALERLKAFAEGGIATAETIPAARTGAGHRLQIRFDVRNPAAERWLAESSGRLIGEIVEDQRAMVRQHLVRGLERGLNPRQTATELVGRISRVTGSRQGGVIGLHSTQEQWLARYADDLASTDPAALRRLLERGLRDKRFDRSVMKALREGTGLPADLQARMRTAYANRVLKWRADTIARTETMEALNEAQKQAFDQAVEKGVVRKDEIRRFVVTAQDERVRETHAAIPGLNADGRGIDEPFDTPMGPLMGPPFGPRCRCIVRYEIDHLGRAARMLRNG